MKTLLILLILFSCSQLTKKPQKVTIIKQWHLSARTMTQDIEGSIKLPQFENQSEIYQFLRRRVENKDKLFLLVEGCEDRRIDDQFQTAYNGWTFKTLKEASKGNSFDKILTFLPLKLKARFPEEVTAECADNEKLMQENNLAISEARGYIGFYLRLLQNQNSPKKFSFYKKALEETEKKLIENPLEHARSGTISSIERFQSLIKKRNDLFLTQIKKHLKENPIMIVGGLHAKDLIQRLEEDGIQTEIITPNGYPETSERLGEDLLKVINTN